MGPKGSVQKHTPHLHGHVHLHNHGDRDVAVDDKEMRREERMIEGSVHYKVDDPRFLEMAKWPIVLMDTTGSMTEATSQGGLVRRSDLLYQVTTALISMLSKVDDAQDMQPIGYEKGCPLITFNAIEGGVFRGFLHAQNMPQIWPTIQFHGATHIMDGWRTMLRTYEQFFTSKLEQVNWPMLLCLILTDGELQDGHEFEEHLKHAHGRLFVEIAVLGYGEDHKRAVHHYKRISQHHHHVRVTEFTNESNPKIICEQLLSLVNPNLINRL